jgi:hypothetical protein
MIKCFNSTFYKQRVCDAAETLLDGWGLDGFKPDRGDVVGSAVALAGVLMIMLWPRGGGDGTGGDNLLPTGVNHRL